MILLITTLKANYEKENILIRWTLCWLPRYLDSLCKDLLVIVKAGGYLEALICFCVSYCLWKFLYNSVTLFGERIFLTALS